MKAYWGVEVQLHTFLTSALYRGQSASWSQGDRRMRWAGHAALMGEMRNVNAIVFFHLEDLGV
jgi:hypothetical protein